MPCEDEEAACSFSISYSFNPGTAGGQLDLKGRVFDEDDPDDDTHTYGVNISSNLPAGSAGSGTIPMELYCGSQVAASIEMTPAAGSVDGTGVACEGAKATMSISCSACVPGTVVPPAD